MSPTTPTLLIQDYRRLEDVERGHIRLSESGRQIIDRGTSAPKMHRGAVNVDKLIRAGLIALTPGRLVFDLTPSGVPVLAAWRERRQAERTPLQVALQTVVTRRGA